MARTMLYKPGNMITCGQFAVDYIIVDDEEVKSHLKKGWVSNVTSTVLNAIANSTSGAIVGGAGGGIAGAAAGALVGAGLKGAVSKIATTRSGRYAIEKAVQEATKAVRAGGSKEALAAAERRFMANKAAVKAIREALGNEEFQRLARAGIVASLSGMAQE